MNSAFQWPTTESQAAIAAKAAQLNTEPTNPDAFVPVPGRGWAFFEDQIGPKNDRQWIIRGTVPLTTTRKLWLEMTMPTKGGTLSVKVKDPNGWVLLDTIEMAQTQNKRRTGTFKVDGRKYRLSLEQGKTADRRTCLHVRLPDVLPTQPQF